SGRDVDAIDAVALAVSRPTIAIVGSGSILVSDTGASRIRGRDDVSHLMTTFAGSSLAGFQGDGGPANAARLTNQGGLVFDLDRNVILADTGNNRIRRVDAVTGVITTIAGTGAAGYGGDGAA